MAAVAGIDHERAQLGLTFAHAPSGETYLKRQYARFPFHVTQPFFLDGDPTGEATVILQGLGAGLVQGDRIAMDIIAEAGSRTHLTTQGSMVAHAMPSDRAVQLTRIEVRTTACFHYLPRPMVLFAGADVTTRLEVVLADEARVLWCDGYLSHDSEQDGGRFTKLDAETRLCDAAGRLLALDRFVIGGTTLDDPGVMAGFPVHAGFGCHGWSDLTGLALQLTSELAGDESIHAGVSTMPDEAGLFGRVLARDGVSLRRAMTTVRDVMKSAG